MSYALARKKGNWWPRSDQHIRADLRPGGRDHHLIAEGGTWWRHVQLYIPDRDGDGSARAEAMRRGARTG